MQSPEETQTEIIEVKKEKKERTQAQKDALLRAREKAMQVRQESAKERMKLKEIESHDKERKNELRRKQIEEEYSRISSSSSKPEEDKAEISDEEEVEIVKRPKKKKIIRVVESSSEDELEFRLPRKKEPIIEKSQADLDHEKRMLQLERTMEKLFTVQ